MPASPVQVDPVISIPGFADPFSSLSHLFGAVVFLVLAAILVWRSRANQANAISIAVFGFGSVLLLSISGVYHMLSPAGASRHVLQVLDHDAIFVLIAASFTPIHVILFRGPGRWGVLAVIWSIAATAITLKTIYFESMPTWLGLTQYLGMGWIGLGTGIAIWRRFGFRFTAPLLWGGLAYSIGAVLEFLKWPVLVPGIIRWHEVFHVAVLAGLAFHWSFVFAIADGRFSPSQRISESELIPDIIEHALGIPES